jgi:hypothetical protein
MNFEEPLVKQLMEALHKPITCELTQDEWVQLREDARLQALGIVGTPAARDRTLDEIAASSEIGFLGEYLIAKHLRLLGFDVINPKLYDYDMIINGTIKIELKYQGLGFETTTIEWDHYRMVNHAVESYEKYDFMLLWKLRDDGSVVPWYLMESKVFDPALKFYHPSIKKKNGVYIQMKE